MVKLVKKNKVATKDSSSKATSSKASSSVLPTRPVKSSPAKMPSKKSTGKLGVNKLSKPIKKVDKKGNNEKGTMRMFEDLQKKIQKMEKKISIAEKKSSGNKGGKVAKPLVNSKPKSQGKLENPDSRDNLKKQVKERPALKTKKTNGVSTKKTKANIKVKSLTTLNTKTVQTVKKSAVNTKKIVVKPKAINTGTTGGKKTATSTGSRKRRREPSPERVNNSRMRRNTPSRAVPTPPPSRRLLENRREGARAGELDEDRHRCSLRCPPSCQGHLRPNEIIIYESFRFKMKVLSGSLKIAPPQPAAALSGGGRRGRKVTPSELEVQPPPVTPARVRLLLDQPPVDFATAEAHSWNTNDRSFNIRVVEDDPLSMRRRPVAQSTDCVRAKVGYTEGLHLFSVTWPQKMRGTHAVVGVATRDAALHAVGYQSLVGNSVFSWGWDLGRLKSYHNTKVNKGTRYPCLRGQVGSVVPDSFHMVIDMDAGTLAFVADNQYLGVAHHGLKGLKVFPCVSTVWGNSEVKLEYLSSLEPGSPLSLQQLARGEVRRSLGTEMTGLSGLSVPQRIKNYLQFRP